MSFANKFFSRIPFFVDSFLYYRKPFYVMQIHLSVFALACLYLRKVKVIQLCPTLCDPIDNTVHGVLQARILKGVAFPFSRGIFPTQGSNPGLLHCRRILYQLSHKGSPRILEWVACSFSSGSSWPRNWTGVSSITGRFFTNWAIREAQYETYSKKHCQGCCQRAYCLCFPVEVLLCLHFPLEVLWL